MKWQRNQDELIHANGGDWIYKAANWAEIHRSFGRFEMDSRQWWQVDI